MSREGGRCVSPLRGRWHKGDCLHGTGGRRVGGGRVATELDCVGFGCIVETLFDDDWIGACTLILHPHTPLTPRPDALSELVWQVTMTGDYDRCLRQVHFDRRL